jgi:hypothetical protein
LKRARRDGADTDGVDQNGTDPITGEGLTRDDLIEVKASTFRVTKPLNL